MLSQGAFATAEDVALVGNNGERYVPLVDPYIAAMHLGHMASYRAAVCYSFGRQVLEIGCGTGYGAHYLASFGAAQVVGLDVEEMALQYARQVHAHTRVRYELGDAEDLPFDNATFEFVFSSQVIEHTASPERVLAEIKRVLKPGGFCLVTTPNKGLFSPLSDRSQNRHHTNEMGLAEFETLGQTFFPRVKMAGVPQKCLVRRSNNTIGLKPNHLLRHEDYRLQMKDLSECENLLLFGHTQPDGEFTQTLPDRLSCAAKNILPCFWDPSTKRWIELGLYPGASGLPSATGSQSGKEVFRSPSDNLFRIDVAVEVSSAVQVSALLSKHPSGGQVLLSSVMRNSDRKLSLVFEPIPDSSGQEFCLELGPARGLADSSPPSPAQSMQPASHDGGLGLWTFHQTLPAPVRL